MFIAVYRDKETNSIGDVHSIGNLSIRELDEKVRRCNEVQGNKNTIEIHHLGDKSLEVFLFNRYMFDKKYYEDALENIAHLSDGLTRKIERFNDWLSENG